jgi:Xaa-Pro aminopeptidase
MCIFRHVSVLETNIDLFKTSLEALKPGLHWDAVQFLCHRVLVRGFQKLGIFRVEAEEASILASGVSAAFFPHGVGHSLGLDVHDVPSASKPTPNPTIVRDGTELGHEKFYEYLRLRIPLESGMVVVRIFYYRFLCWHTCVSKADADMDGCRRSSRGYTSINTCSQACVVRTL